MLAFDRIGQGATVVVLLHGVGGGRTIWGEAASGTARRLAESGCTVLALDLPGYGDSPAIAPLTLAAMAAAVRETLALALPADGPRPVVLGHSLGGMVALELAALAPSDIAGLVLACTSPAFGKPDGDWQQAFLRERLAPLDAGQGMAALAGTLVRGMVAQGTPQEVVDRAAAVMARVSEATYRAALQALMGFDRRALLPQLQMPVLCLAAEYDRNAPPEVVRRMAERIPGADFALLPACGHLANVEQPQAFHDAVDAFLALRCGGIDL